MLAGPSQTLRSQMPKPNEQQIEKIAQVMHEAARAWRAANGQPPPPSWSRAPKWMRDASREAVVWRLDNPRSPSSAQHDQWLAQKKAAGWKYGKIKSGVKKTHPMMLPYSELPEVERRKDAMIGALVDALAKPLR